MTRLDTVRRGAAGHGNAGETGRGTSWRGRARHSKPNKYGAQRTELDGYSFDSKAEAKVYAQLKLLERGGEISRLSVHPKWRIIWDGFHICDFTADFSFFDVREGRFRVIDVKGKPTAARRDFKLVCKMMQATHKIDVEVWAL